MTFLDDETLVAYVDGELPPDRQAEVGRALASDPAAARLVEGLRADQMLIRRAFEVAPAHPTELSGTTPDNVVALAPRRPRSRFGRMALPLAAAVAGLIVGAGATGLALRGSGDGDLAALAFASQSERLATLQNSLETAPSGTQVAWTDDSSRSNGTLTVVRSFQAPDGSYCREFTEDMTTSDTRLHVLGVACREGQSWRTKVQVIES